jgi:lysozyme family protein
MGTIFISHSSHNIDRAKEVFDWLTANGWDDVFLDLDPERGIVAGQRWKDALQKAAQRCEVVLALVSKEWLASRWCKAEIDTAQLMGKKVIIALIGVDKSEVPLDLTDQQWVDLDAGATEYKRLAAGLRLAGLDPATFELEAGRRPYPGFAFFDEKDAAIFFGRDGEIVRAIDRIRGLARVGVDRMLIILGASGSGKSSFVRAGLLPRLNRDERTWLPLPTIRPERAVISGNFGLAEALLKKISEERFANEFRKRELPRSRAAIQNFIESDEDGLLKIFDALREIAHEPILYGEKSSPPTIVLALDQGEELFNEDGRDEAKRFIDILTRTLKADPARALTLVAMRSDALPRLQAERLLAEFPKDTFPLEAMAEGSYRAVIEGPARLLKPKPLKIDPRLTDELLKDVSGQDALPLLAFTLAHLYDNYSTDNELNVTDYEKIGRLKGVLETTVKDAFADGAARGELPKNENDQLALWRESFIPHLAQVNAAGQSARRVARRDELPAKAGPLIDRFAERRLLIKDRRTDLGEDVEVIEVAHEALLRQPPLSTWLVEDQEFMIWRQRLARMCEEFKANERGLLVGRELQRAREWTQTRPGNYLSASERKFIDDSILEDEKQRKEAAERERKLQEDEREKEQARARLRKQRIALAVTVLLVFAVGGGWVYAYLQQREATAQRAIAESAQRAAETQKEIADQQRVIAETQKKEAERLAAQNASLLNILDLFVTSTIPPNMEAKLESAIQRLLIGRARYESLGNKVNIPWYFIGIIHGIDSEFEFTRHLHNGDKLTARTVHVPVGRPPEGNPPFSWEESATDYLKMEFLGKSTSWGVAQMLEQFERSNGLGYRRRGINSPYLWSCTNHYTKGQFVADGKFSPTAVAQYCGAAAMLKRLVEKGLISFS